MPLPRHDEAKTKPDEGPLVAEPNAEPLYPGEGSNKRGPRQAVRQITFECASFGVGEGDPSGTPLDPSRSASRQPGTE